MVDILSNQPDELQRRIQPDPRFWVAVKELNLGVSQNWGYPFGGPYNKDYSILGSILGSPYFRKLPFKLLYYPPMMENQKKNVKHDMATGGIQGGIHGFRNLTYLREWVDIAIN